MNLRRRTFVGSRLSSRKGLAAVQAEARIFTHLPATFRTNIALLKAPDNYLCISRPPHMNAVGRLIVAIDCGCALALKHPLLFKHSAMYRTLFIIGCAL